MSTHTLGADQTTEEIQHIEQHQTALNLLPDGKVKERLRADLLRLKSILDMKRLLSD
jgi:hypothetical protein